MKAKTINYHTLQAAIAILVCGRGFSESGCGLKIFHVCFAHTLYYNILLASL